MSKRRKPYPSNLTNEQRAILGTLIPLAKTGGRPCSVDMREVVNGILLRSIHLCRHDPDNGQAAGVNDRFSDILSDMCGSLSGVRGVVMWDNVGQAHGDD